MNEPMQNRVGDNSPQATATISDRLGVIALILASIAIGAVLMLPKVYEAKLDVVTDSATRAENHARNAETKVGILEAKIELLAKEAPPNANRK